MPHNQYWIDGFNLFHAWESTKYLFRSREWDDPCTNINRALQLLSDLIGRDSVNVTVFMDGGIRRGVSIEANLKVRYSGPGGKADSTMKDAANSVESSEDITAITNDRELAASLRVCGLRVVDVGAFIESYINPGSDGSDESYKHRRLSQSEIVEWEEYFGDIDI